MRPEGAGRGRGRAAGSFKLEAGRKNFRRGSASWRAWLSFARAACLGAGASLALGAVSARAGEDAGPSDSPAEASPQRAADPGEAGAAAAGPPGAAGLPASRPAPVNPSGASAGPSASETAKPPHAAAPPKPAPPKTAQQLELESRLTREKAAAAQLAQKESGLLGKLADLERQIEVESRALRAAQARLRVSNARLAQSELRARTAEDKVAVATQELGPRLTARYRLGREAYVRFLLGAHSIEGVLRRKRLFSALLERDFDALAELRFHAQGAKAARDDLAHARDELAQSAAAEQEKRAALQSRVDAQKRMLASVQQEKSLHEEAVRELDEAAHDLARQLAELQKKGPPPAAPAPDKPGAQAPLSIGTMQLSGEQPIRSARGKLLFPVEVGRIEQRFGRAVDPRFGTITLQRGIDVRAPEGTEIHAVHGGKVVHAGWFRGYGNLLIIDHGGGVFSLMAHLASLDRAVGDEVRRGDRVGTVGDTGSLKGAYLYFELRDGQKPLDPERWLGRKGKPGTVAASKSH